MSDQIDEIKIEDLIPDDHNANLGTKRGEEAIQKSVQEFGAGRSIVIDKNRKIIGGNKTVRALKKEGIKRVIIVRTKGDELVAVQREDLDLDSPDGKARALAVFDNRTNELDLEWDYEQLALVNSDELLKLFTMEELGVSPEEELQGEDFPEFDDGEIDKDGYINFRFGDYSGKVAKETYDKFVEEYKRHQEESGEPILDDVLRSWLNV